MLDKTQAKKWTKTDAFGVVKIHERLKELLLTRKDGSVKYSKGYSDGKLARELGVKQASITYIRLKDFGSMNVKHTDVPAPVLVPLEKRVADLEAVVADLQRRLVVASIIPPLGKLV